MAKSAVKLTDIGEQLGLSVSTVSSVLNGRNTRHSPATKRRVWDLAQKLDYRPNYAARSMRTQRTSTIGIIAPLLSTELDEMEDACSSSGYTMSIGLFHNDRERQAARILEFKQKHIDGLLVLHPLKKSPAVNDLQDYDYPVVVVDVVDNYPGIDTFFIGVEKAVCLAMEHLQSLGHRRIALLTHHGESDYGQIRFENWCKMMRASGVQNYQDYYYPTKSKYPNVEYILNSAYQSAKAITMKYEKSDKSRPTAVLAVADKLAIPAVRAFEESGWSVPRDISIISAESSEYGRYCSTPLTSICTNDRTIHNEALVHLISLIENRNQGPRPLKKFTDIELQTGSSTLQISF